MGEGIPKGVVTVELGKPPQVVKDSAGFDEQKLPREVNINHIDPAGGFAKNKLLDDRSSRYDDYLRLMAHAVE